MSPGRIDPRGATGGGEVESGGGFHLDGAAQALEVEYGAVFHLDRLKTAAEVENGQGFLLARWARGLRTMRVGWTLRAWALLLVLAAVSATPVLAQVIPVYSVTYRPPGVSYLVMRSAHFDVIYQEGAEAQARELAASLESTLPAVSRLFPTRDDFRVPVVLNRYNDRGNGFVATVPFKSEIEGVGIFGRGLSVRHSDWLMGVGPHELVHAAQADYSAGFGVHSLLRPFVPDIARALNLWNPPGIAEGAAVYLESSLEPRAGRLNHPWFTMQYRAAVGAGKPWSLAQMLERPWYTRPRDRFYKGGAVLMEALADSTGDISALTRATRFHNRFPLLGYGVSFWAGLGEWPRSFGKRFRREAISAEASRVDALGPLTDSRLIAGKKGQVFRNPRWLDDETLVAYMTAYEGRRGLFRVNASDGSVSALAYEELTEDLQFAASADGTSLLAARYIQRPFVAGEASADIFEIGLDGGSRRLTTGGHLLSPVEVAAKQSGAGSHSIWAIRLDGAFHTVVQGRPDEGFRPVFPPARERYKLLEASPDRSRIAIIRNVLGNQGLYITDAATPELEPAVVLQDASVYDAKWSPDGEWIVFSADPTEVVNIFALEVDTGRIRQLTNVAYGAFEGTVSPDGRRLAFVQFQDQRFDLREIPFAPEQAPMAELQRTSPPEPGAFVDTVGVAVLDGEYNALEFLRPRLIYPTAYYETTSTGSGGAELGFGGGLALQGTDPLARWAYWGEAFYQGERLWGEAGLTTSASILRPRLRLFRRPDQLVAQIGSGSTADTTRVIRDERGAEFSVGVPIVLSDNIHRSTAQVALFANVQENRLLGAGSEVLRDWTQNLAITPVVSLRWGMQNALRDLIFSRGITFQSATEFEFVPERFGGQGTASYNEVGIYLPFLSPINNGLKLELAALSQSRAFVFNTDFFMPRGHEDVVPGRGTVIRLGVESVQPILFPDNGLLILPAFLRSVYAYGFGERLVRASDFSTNLTSVGGGVGIQLNLLHYMEFDLRIGRAYRSGDSPYQGWTTVFR